MGIGMKPGTYGPRIPVLCDYIPVKYEQVQLMLHEYQGEHEVDLIMGSIVYAINTFDNQAQAQSLLDEIKDGLQKGTMRLNLKHTTAEVETIDDKVS